MRRRQGGASCAGLHRRKGESIVAHSAAYSATTSYSGTRRHAEAGVRARVGP